MKLAVRLFTAALALALIALAFADDPYLGGGEGFGGSQAALLVLGAALGAVCFAPLAWNGRALALLISIGLTLSLAEGVLQQTLGPRYRTAVQLDDRVLYKLIPGAQREYTRPAINGGVRIRYGINSQGFRGEELAPRGQALRVVVYGDSFTQAEYTRTEDTFAERLEAHLARRLGTAVEVVNAGVAGYGPDQELRRMEDELGELAPDLVVVAIYAGNDFGDLVRNKLYRLSPDGSLADNPFTLDESYARRIVVGRNEPMVKKLLRDALKLLRGDPNDDVATGHAARLARTESALAQLVAEYREFVIEGDDVVHELMSDPYNADVSLLPESESARYRVALMEQIVARMRRTAEARHVPLLLVLIPTPIDVADEHESGEVDRARYPAYRPEALTDQLARIAAQAGVPAVNLFPPFAARGARALYLEGVDDHWNERGQDFGAERVADFAVAQGLLHAPARVAP